MSQKGSSSSSRGIRTPTRSQANGAKSSGTSSSGRNGGAKDGERHHHHQRIDSGNTTQIDATWSSLSAATLEKQNADASGLLEYWRNEEEKRIDRLVKASRQLGFELPRNCY